MLRAGTPPSASPGGGPGNSNTLFLRPGSPGRTSEANRFGPWGRLRSVDSRRHHRAMPLTAADPGFTRVIGPIDLGPAKPGRSQSPQSWVPRHRHRDGSGRSGRLQRLSPRGCPQRRPGLPAAHAPASTRLRPQSACRPGCVRIFSITGCQGTEALALARHKRCSGPFESGLTARMAAMIFNSPPQFGPCSRSNSSTRLSSRAQLSRTGRWCARLASHSAPDFALVGGRLRRLRHHHRAQLG